MPSDNGLPYRSEKRIAVPSPGMTRHMISVREAAQHVADMTGRTAAEVLAEWVVEREALFVDISRAAERIIMAAGQPNPNSAFAKESVPRIARRWVWELAAMIRTGRHISDYRLFADSPLRLHADEVEELAQARVVIAEVRAWFAMDASKVFSLADAEARIGAALRDYDAAVNARLSAEREATDANH